MKPNFMIIGAARSGTTSLHKYLEAHPDVFMSSVKEINFFSNERYWHKGVQWYESHFKNIKQLAIGEASTSYTNYPIMGNVPERIYKYNPDVKLIYLLRDPIDRMLSHYLHKIRRAEHVDDINDIIYRKHDDQLIMQSRYYLQLERYLEFFDMKTILLVTLDELKISPQETMKKIFKFIGVDERVRSPEFSKTHNANKIITRKNWFGRKTLRFYHNHLEQRDLPYPVKKMFVLLAEIGAVEVGKPLLGDDDYQVLSSVFRDDVEKIKKILGRNNLGWREYG